MIAKHTLNCAVVVTLYGEQLTSEKIWKRQPPGKLHFKRTMWCKYHIVHCVCSYGSNFFRQAYYMFTSCGLWQMRDIPLSLFVPWQQKGISLYNNHPPIKTFIQMIGIQFRWVFSPMTPWSKGYALRYVHCCEDGLPESGQGFFSRVTGRKPWGEASQNPYIICLKM